MTTSTKTTLSAALQYLMVDGLSVIPVGKNKVPLIKWEEYTKRKPTEEAVTEWFTKWPSAWVGIVTGKVSGITVVDIDVKHEAVTDYKQFGASYVVKTKSGGWHLYFKYTDKVITCSDQYEQFPYTDIRNDGGYVVAPPSEGYELLEGGEWKEFPVTMFGGGRKSGSGGRKSGFKLQDGVGVTEGGRNDTLARTIGSLLRSMPSSVWETEVWPTVLQINQTYVPPLPEDEVKRTFESIANKEKLGRSDDSEKVIPSPVEVSDTDVIKMRLRGNKSGPFKDVANAVYALGAHSDWRMAFRYDAFTKVVYFRGKPMRDKDITEAQMWMQCELDMNGISRKVVEEAVEVRSKEPECLMDSALEWLEALEWDGKARLDDWLHKVYGVENDEYHQKVGSNWLRALVRRQVWPGSKYDHVLVIQGGQGVRKTTSFSALGGPWHVETTIQADSKDFLMQFDGKAIVEFSEGDTLNRSETKTLKAIITRQIDKYRAPYGRRDEEHPRRCVFCMTTNESEFLKDNTGNRRWLVVRMPDGAVADVEWLEENREQLFAEAYARREENVWEIPQDVAEQMQDAVRMADAMEEDVLTWWRALGQEGRDEGVTVKEFYEWLYANKENVNPVIPRDFEWRVKGIFVGVLKLKHDRRRINGEKRRAWFE